MSYFNKINSKIILSFLLMFLFCGKTQAQFYSAGQDPGSTVWRQINTSNFQVIFPKGYENQGNYIANLLEWAYENGGITLEHAPRKVSVIVHNQTVVSNGFVSWAPRRMELYTTPPADNDHHFWIDHLVIHEFRHVVQVDKLNQGITRLLGILFGEMGTGLVVAHLPLWFIEGDAVVTETTLTRAGRGRLPVFEQGLRSQILTKGAYSFDKARFGSFRDHVPDHYELGYQLVANARVKYGANVFSPAMNNVARRPYLPNPFSSGFKRQTGIGTKRLYRETFNHLDSVWRQQHLSHQYTQAQTISPTEKLFTNYQYPSWVNDSTLVAYKTSLRDIPQIVLLHFDGREETISRPGFVFENSVHSAAGIVAWSQLSPDARWQQRSYANIMVYDLHTSTLRQLTRKGKFFSPAVSPDGKYIAVVEISETSQNSMVLLETATGFEKWRYTWPDNDFIMQPSWHQKENKLAVVLLNNQGKRIETIDIGRKLTEVIFIARDADISTPTFQDDNILFTGTWSGINNIYIIKPGESEPSQLVSSEFGATAPAISPSGKFAAWSDYTANGYKILAVELDNLSEVPLSEVENYSPQLYKVLEKQDNEPVSPANIPITSYQVKPYRRISTLFHLHSWFPAMVDVDNIVLNPGVSLFFQNKLSTSFAQLGYEWDWNNETGRYSASYTYRGWYPVVELKGETGYNRLYYTADNHPYNFLWLSNNLNINLSIPLRTQYNHYFYGITPSFQLGLNQATSGAQTPDSIFVGNNRYFTFSETRFLSQSYNIFAYVQRRTVPRDIYPRFAQFLDLSYSHTPWGGADMGNVAAVRSVTFLPSLMRHHGIRITAATQRKNEQKDNTIARFYSFNDRIPYPRGVIGQSHQTLSMIGVDYVFPLLYPDVSIPYLAYIQRIRSGVFYDYAVGRRFTDEVNVVKGIRENLSSWGYTLSIDVNLLGFFSPFVLGVQVAYPSTTNKPDYRFIYSVNL